MGDSTKMFVGCEKRDRALMRTDLLFGVDRVELPPAYGLELLDHSLMFLIEQSGNDQPPIFAATVASCALLRL